MTATTDARPSMKPGIRPPPEKAIDEKSYDLALLMRLWPYARGHKLLFGIACVLVPVVTLAGLAQPVLVRNAIWAAAAERSVPAVGSVAAMFAVAISIEFVARFIQTWTLQLAGQRTVADLRKATFERVLRLPLSYLDRTPIGRVTTRVTNDSDTLGELFASGAILAFADFVTLVGIVIAMLWLDVTLALVVLCVLPPLAFAVDRIRRGARDAFRSIRVAIAALNAYVAEQVQGMLVVQALAREDVCLEEHEGLNAVHRDANYRAIRYDALLYSVVESVSAITVAILLWTAAVRVLGHGETEAAIEVGTVVAFFEYVTRFFVPIRDLSQKWTILQSSLAAAERVFALLGEPGEDAPGGTAANGAPGDVAVELDHVTFAYRADHPVMHDVSLKVRRGEKVALVGPTGSGKTTVTSLAMRLYDVAEGNGRVRVLGRDVREWKREALRSQLAVVSQDVFLFAGTVLENVTGFDEKPERERAIAALRDVGALDRIEKRGGLDARIDERGTNWSAGERQLVAMARALYLDRKILVLDEATANVDSETESRLQTAIARVLEGRTAIVIAHRLSTIRAADRIVVLQRGRVAEEGTHTELLAKDGLYKKLHDLQFADAEAGASVAGASLADASVAE